MLTEVKILFDNIKFFRKLLTESVSDNDIIKYIENHEYLYIYYAGDGENKKGYRTIRPYVLGVSTSGNKVIRAWQDNKKNSYTFDNRPTRPDSYEHDYWNDEGGVKPGWRLFNLDKIEKVYPTGKRFHNSDGSVMIPPKYKEGSDAGMSSIIAYVSTKNEPVIEPVEPEEPTQMGDKKTKWDNFSHANKNNRKITADDVLKLRDIASRVYKKSRGSFLVVINNNDDFDIINVKDKNKVPQSAIVGTLTNLFDTLVKQRPPEEDSFFKNSIDKVKKEIEAKAKESESPTIPFDKKTFFK